MVFPEPIRAFESIDELAALQVGNSAGRIAPEPIQAGAAGRLIGRDLVSRNQVDRVHVQDAEMERGYAATNTRKRDGRICQRRRPKPHTLPT